MYGIQVKYVELLSLSVEQSFYQNNICRRYQSTPVLDIYLQPTSECLAVMNRMNFIFRNMDINGGFVVFSRVLGKNGGGDDLLRFPARPDDKLTFWILINNPDFLNFDDLVPQPDPGSFYYFSNQVSDLAAPRTGLHLTIDPSGVKGLKDIVARSGSLFRYHHPALVAPNTAKIKHLLSGIVLDPVSIINDAGQSDLIFNLSSLPLGSCQLTVSGAPIQSFYYSGDLPGQPVFGIVELSLSALLAANYRLIEADRSLTPQRPVYKIHFKNRLTTWRYTIHLLPNSPLTLEMAALSPADKITFINELNIVTNDTTILFNRQSVNDTDIVFVSQHPVMLQEKYTSSTSATHDALSLTLKKYVGDLVKEAAVRNDLAFPPTGLIDATGLPAIYSDVFITI